MEYETYYEISWEPLNNESKYKEIDLAYLAYWPEVFCEECESPCNTGGWAKWYEHERWPDMAALSKIYPHLVFTVQAWGDDAGDLWREYWHNGKVQEIFPTIKWPMFHPSELKEPK